MTTPVYTVATDAFGNLQTARPRRETIEMAQFINVRKIGEAGDLIHDPDINFAPIADYLFQYKETLGQYPWLNAIDEYGDTTFNRFQSVYVIEELHDLSTKIRDDTLKQVINDLINFFKTIETHEYIKFFGD